MLTLCYWIDYPTASSGTMVIKNATTVRRPADMPIIKNKFSNNGFLMKLPKMLVNATQIPVIINRRAVQNDFFETLTFIIGFLIAGIRIFPNKNKSKS